MYHPVDVSLAREVCSRSLWNHAAAVEEGLGDPPARYAPYMEQLNTTVFAPPPRQWIHVRSFRACVKTGTVWEVQVDTCVSVIQDTSSAQMAQDVKMRTSVTVHLLHVATSVRTLQGALNVAVHRVIYSVKMDSHAERKTNVQWESMNVSLNAETL